MSEETEAVLMNSDELFKLRPSKKLDRWLFRGELRVSKVTKRNPSHSSAVAKISHVLLRWLEGQPLPRGNVYSGEAYFRIRKSPDTNVGIDVALSSATQVSTTGKKRSYIDGPPVLAVEVLSPYDKVKDIDESIEEYLECGVKLVWIVDPYDETVTVYASGKNPELFNLGRELTGEPDLPGFRCRVSELL